MAAIYAALPSDLKDLVDRHVYAARHRPNQQRCIDHVRCAMRSAPTPHHRLFQCYRWADAMPHHDALYMWAAFCLPRASMRRYDSMCGVLEVRRASRFFGPVG